MEASTIATIIVAVIGSGGLSALLTSILSARKYKSEAMKTEQEAEGLRVQNEITEMDYINKRLQEISENASRESIKLRQRNDILNAKISELNDKLQSMMEWVMYDNQQYRQWLETELRKVNPTIEFPRCAPPPKIFHVDKVVGDTDDDKNETDDD